MNITRRRGAIATFITLGVLLVGLTVTLNITWIVLHKSRLAYLILGIILFAVLLAGVVLNTVFLVREIRRNERQDSFLNAVTHELKTPIASIRLYLETLQRRPTSEEQKQEFYKIMLSDSDRLLATVEQVLKAGQLGQRHRQQNRTLINLESLVADCIAITLQRHHLNPDSIVLEPVPGAVRLQTLGIAEDLRTAVINVLDNAVKYSPEGVHVRCSLAIVNYTSIALTHHRHRRRPPLESVQAHLQAFLPRPRPHPWQSSKAPASASSSSATSPASTAATPPPPAPALAAAPPSPSPFPSPALPKHRQYCSRNRTSSPHQAASNPRYNHL